MKKVKSIQMVFVLFLSTLFFVSCSKEDEQVTNESSNKKLDNYLKSFYSDKYSLGDKVKVSIQNPDENHLKTT